jgi:uncharacterized protein YbjT (DUF2867 family)
LLLLSGARDAVVPPAFAERVAKQLPNSMHVIFPESSHGNWGPPIHERDIAAVAVRALCEDGHAGAKYILTGPQSLTQRDQVHTIGDAIGRPLRFEEIPPEAARREMVNMMPASIADMLIDAWQDVEYGGLPRSGNQRPLRPQLQRSPEFRHVPSTTGWWRARRNAQVVLPERS